MVNYEPGYLDALYLIRKYNDSGKWLWKIASSSEANYCKTENNILEKSCFCERER